MKKFLIIALVGLVAGSWNAVSTAIVTSANPGCDPVSNSDIITKFNATQTKLGALNAAQTTFNAAKTTYCQALKDADPNGCTSNVLMAKSAAGCN